MNLVGVGESSSPPRCFSSEIVNHVFNRLLETNNQQALTAPDHLRHQLEAHLSRLPSSYALDINLDRAEEVLLHQKLLALAKNPKNRPVFHVRLLENFWARADADEDLQELTVGPGVSDSSDRNREMGFEPCSKLKDLNLKVQRSSLDKDKEDLDGDSYTRKDDSHVPIHEVIFSAVDKPKLLSQLSALLSDIGLNIREAHVFSTTDGYSLDVFVVDGWPLQESQALQAAMERAIARSKIINHQPYDEKADVFSFAIVLWELLTAKISYDNMTPLQAALGVRQGHRPDLPTNTNPKLLELMQRCWETDPAKRPSFSDIKVELVRLLQEIQEDQMASVDTVFNCVIPYIQNGDDRNSVSLVCRKWNEIDCFTRKHATVHVNYAPTPSRLFKRFQSLESITLKGIKNSNTSIDITQWIREIAIKFTRLESVYIRNLVIRDSDLEFLAKNRGKDLVSLKISECKGFSENGLMCVAMYCSKLRELVLEGIDLVKEEVEEHGKWLRVLALRKTGMEKFSHRYNSGTTLFNQEDVVFLLERCRESLVSLRVDDYLIHLATQAITNAVNLQDFFGAYFYEDEQYSGFKLPSSIHSLGLSDMPQGSIRFVDHLLNQLRELDFRWIDVPEDCQCLFLQRCPNLEVLYMEDACGDLGLELISQVCKKLRKLTLYSGTRVGLMAVALGCLNLEYLLVVLTDISNEALECIGSNLKNLRVFYIRLEGKEYNTISPLDNGIRAMLIGCTKLEKLSLRLRPKLLSNSGLGFIGVYGVNLKSLSLDRIGGSDEGLIELSKGCHKLRKLELTNCLFHDQAIKNFWCNVKSLRYIWFKNADDTGLALTRPDFDMVAKVTTHGRLYWVHRK